MTSRVSWSFIGQPATVSSTLDGDRAVGVDHRPTSTMSSSVIGLRISGSCTVARAVRIGDSFELWHGLDGTCGSAAIDLSDPNRDATPPRLRAVGLAGRRLAVVPAHPRGDRTRARARTRCRGRACRWVGTTCLLQLAEAPDRRLRMAELADRVLLSRSGLTRLVDRLAGRGAGHAGSRPRTTPAGTYTVLTDAGFAAAAPGRAGPSGRRRSGTGCRSSPTTSCTSSVSCSRRIDAGVSDAAARPVVIRDCARRRPRGRRLRGRVRRGLGRRRADACCRPACSRCSRSPAAPSSPWSG